MSFKLSKQKKIGGKYPIAKILGAKKNDKKYLYLGDFQYKISECPADVLNEINENEKVILNNALISGQEPEDEELTKIFYRCKEWIKKKNCKFILRGKGLKFQYLPNQKYTERMMIAGISGSGKSTWCSSYIKEYLKQHRKNPFYILSNVAEDDVLDKLDPVRLELSDIVNNGMLVEEIEDSILLFDDTGSIENAPLRKGIQAFQNNLLEVSRHYNTHLLNTSHHIQNYAQTRTLLNEATCIVLFPKSNTKAIKQYLKTYENFDNDEINRCLNLNSRWFALVKATNDYPAYILTERQVYII